MALLNENPGAELGIKQPEGLPVRLARSPSGGSSPAVVGRQDGMARESLQARNAHFLWRHFETGARAGEPRRSDGATFLMLWFPGKTRVLGELAEINMVGHRIVNGGREYTRPTPITREVKAAIEKMAAFAPLHNRVELEGIALIERKCGSLPQVAVFDTAFHSGLSEQRRSIPDRTSGPSVEFASSVFTGSTISTAPGGRRNATQGSHRAETRKLSPRQWLLPGGNSGWAKYRYHHGFYATRRFDDEHAIRFGRSRNPHVLAARRPHGQPSAR